MDSLTSPSSPTIVSELATHSSPGPRAAPPRTSLDALAPPDIDPCGGQRWGDQPLALDAVVGEPVRELFLTVGQLQRPQARSGRVDLAPQGRPGP